MSDEVGECFLCELVCYKALVVVTSVSKACIA
jgi:hypothetical protein